MLCPVFTCIVEADHREDNELLVFLSSPQNLLHNFFKVWMPFEKRNQKPPRNLDELQGEQASYTEDPPTGRHHREPGEVGTSQKTMT